MCCSPRQAYDSDTELYEMLEKFKGSSKHHSYIYVKNINAVNSTSITVIQNLRLACCLQGYVGGSPRITEDASSTVSGSG